MLINFIYRLSVRKTLRVVVSIIQMTTLNLFFFINSKMKDYFYSKNSPQFNRTPADMVDLNNLPNISPQQLVGFCDAEASFYVGVTPRRESRLGFQVRVQFTIKLGVDSVSALFAIKNYFGGVGTISWANSAQTAVQYSISSVKDIRNFVIPLFELFHLMSSKRQNYEDFLRVITIIESNQHLTSKGLEVIRNIAKAMNTVEPIRTKFPI